MKIGLIGPLNSDTKIDKIQNGLFQLGITPVHLGAYKSSSRINNFISTQVGDHFPFVNNFKNLNILNNAKQFEIDFMINVEQEVHPKVISELKSLGIPSACWYPDGIGNINPRQFLLFSEYKKIFMTDPELVNRLSRLYDLPTEYLHESFDPDWHKPVGEFGIKKTCVVVGNYYPSRLHILSKLQNLGIPLTLYGNPIPKWSQKAYGWKFKIMPPVTKLEKSRVFHEAQAVLNLVNLDDVQSTNQRLFEAAGAGAAIVMDRSDALASLFQEGKDVLMFNNFSELVSQIDRLLNDRQFGQRLGNAARARASEYTTQNRLTKIIESMV